jgi:hypothetical protein
VANKVGTSRDIRKIEGESLIRFLVYDDKSKLIVEVAPSKDTPGVRVGVSELNESSIVSEESTVSGNQELFSNRVGPQGLNIIPSVEPVSQTNGSILSRSRPVCSRVNAIPTKYT